MPRYYGQELCADVQQRPEVRRLTAKKNWASSMQDHKAGSVDAYDALFKEMGMKNEAMAADPKIRVAVCRRPFIGFSKSVNEEGQDVYPAWVSSPWVRTKGTTSASDMIQEAFRNFSL